MFKIVLLVLPAAAITYFIAVKLPPQAKDWFFKIPIWISSSAIAFIIGGRLHGVMGPYAGILCDFILMPIFSVIKKIHMWKKSKELPTTVSIPKKKFSFAI